MDQQLFNIVLATIYASAQASEVLIPTIEIRHASMPSVYICMKPKRYTVKQPY